MPDQTPTMFILEREQFDSFLAELQQRGYTTLGPIVRDGAITYDEVSSSAELPVGWTDEHGAGAYRLHKRNDKALFGFVVGPYSWKKFLFPPLLKIFSVEKKGKAFTILPSTSGGGDGSEGKGECEKFAFLGVRSCELHALHIQDKIFYTGEYVDPHYNALRQNIFIVAVNCTQPGGTCFCGSMNTGPKATVGFDLALTEIIDEKEHYFVVEIGSERGQEVVSKLSLRSADSHHINESIRLVETASRHMGRTMDITNIKSLLQENFEHPRWENVAKRCLTCANCTMVCPTCFCTTIEDVTDLTGDHAERWRKWDSCFTMDFSYIHGGSIRPSVKSRYRQWMSHKLANWIDQFGTSGCVGCGRCIAWCPVGIDITEEVPAIRNSKLQESSTLSV